jgi:hypothetical protein
MKTLFRIVVVSLAALAFVAGAQTSSAQTQNGASPDTRLFELRTYYAAEGKLDALNARFRNHTLKIFEKHGMVNVGYWMPTENPDRKLVYLLAFPHAEARNKAWKEFGADPEWKAAAKASEANGKLVNKVESVLLRVNDYSPAIRPAKSTAPRIFELRQYKASPGNLANLNARFRNHTLALFAKHGLTSIGYWTPADPKQGSEDTLVYLLAFPSREAATESWKNFRADPAWIEARKASETKAGGSLTVTDGVQSVFMAPTDYSPMQ